MRKHWACQQGGSKWARGGHGAVAAGCMMGMRGGPSLAGGAGSWDPAGTISTASAEGGTQGRVICPKMQGTGFALGCERVPGVSQGQAWGNVPASPRNLRMRFPAGGFGPGGSTERSAGARSAGRKLLRLPLSCLISLSRTRLFWKHAVGGEKPTKERRQGG